MTFLRSFAAAAVAVAFIPNASAQLAKSQEIEVKFGRVEAGVQYTPDFKPQNIKDKRWNWKQWLEIDAAFGLKKNRQGQDKSPIVNNMEFKYYVVLNKRDADGKLTLLTASITYLNADETERELHAMAYVSPASLSSVLENSRYTMADLTPSAIAIVVLKGGAVAGFYNQGGGPTGWWDKTDNFRVVDGVLLPKSKTPFAPLWGDYDLETPAQ
jgi:hypothetical protein